VEMETGIKIDLSQRQSVKFKDKMGIWLPSIRFYPASFTPLPPNMSASQREICPVHLGRLDKTE
jgi:hypothetical protein